MLPMGENQNIVGEVDVGFDKFYSPGDLMVLFCK